MAKLKKTRQPGPDANPLADLMPTDPLMVGPWLGSVQYCLGRADMRAAFERETGQSYRPARSVFDRMIDDATGADLAYVRAFVRWHNENIWGDLDITVAL